MILNRRDGQNAADLASLAGARIVGQNYTQSPKTQHDVFTAIRSSLDVNDCLTASGTPCTPDPRFVTFVNNQPVDLGPVADIGAAIPAGAVGVKVGVTREPGAVVGRIVGFDHWTVSVEATASVAKPDTWADGVMLPIAVCGWDSTAAPNDCALASNNPAPGNFIDFHAGPGLRPHRRQGCPGRLRLAELGRLERRRRALRQHLQPEQPALLPRQPV